VTAAGVTVGVMTVRTAGVSGFGTTLVVAGVGLMIAMVVSIVVGIGGTK
jgi:hypothetical protein